MEWARIGGIAMVGVVALVGAVVVKTMLLPIPSKQLLLKKHLQIK